ncbi:MAG: FAD-binding protein [Eubacterium sp.]|nr:FAD-binding protein [Eubacterium sp.]
MPVNVVGAGLAGLSAALCLAEAGTRVNLISAQASERAQSVLAEGGINGALNTMGEGDRVEDHFADTIKAGVYLGNEEAIRGMTEAAPDIIRKLAAMGVPFHTRDQVILQRNFGGQKKKRTAYARSSTGKILMTAMIEQVRKYQVQGLVRVFDHHEFVTLKIQDKTCQGLYIRDTYKNRFLYMEGPTLMAVGGMAGLFPGKTTGSLTNSGYVQARLLRQGVNLGNLEMIQYHPTTMQISGKSCLVSEAARGEGARLCVERQGKLWYFMEEKYPELGNLMPRDVVAREEFFVARDPACGRQIYLDFRQLPDRTWREKIPDMREEIIHYFGLDPKKDLIPVEPGIHYFMGGIHVDRDHKTNLTGLLAAGECCDLYHGANRLGGNSLLGAIYGGQVAARTALSLAWEEEDREPVEVESVTYEPAREDLVKRIGEILFSALGIVRCQEELEEALGQLEALRTQAVGQGDFDRIGLAEAMVESALLRRESRGAHYRQDYPDLAEDMKRQTLVFGGEELAFGFEEKNTGN